MGEEALITGCPRAGGNGSPYMRVVVAVAPLLVEAAAVQEQLVEKPSRRREDKIKGGRASIAAVWSTSRRIAPSRGCRKIRGRVGSAAFHGTVAEIAGGSQEASRWSTAAMMLRELS